MKLKILEDAQRRPDLFFWNGAIDAAILNEWLQKRSLTLPPDLVTLLVQTGGGDIFESEMILGPFPTSDLDEDIEQFNSYHYDRGLSKQYLIFHTGIMLSAVDLWHGTIVHMEEQNYQEIARYCELNDWYESTVRYEFAERYGL